MSVIICTLWPTENVLIIHGDWRSVILSASVFLFFFFLFDFWWMWTPSWGSVTPAVWTSSRLVILYLCKKNACALCCPSNSAIMTSHLCIKRGKDVQDCLDPPLPRRSHPGELQRNEWDITTKTDFIFVGDTFTRMLQGHNLPWPLQVFL